MSLQNARSTKLVTTNFVWNEQTFKTNLQNLLFTEFTILTLSEKTNFHVLRTNNNYED